jgi:cell division septation protein DedD
MGITDVNTADVNTHSIQLYPVNSLQPSILAAHRIGHDPTHRPVAGSGSNRSLPARQDHRKKRDSDSSPSRRSAGEDEETESSKRRPSVEFHSFTNSKKRRNVKTDKTTNVS